MNKPASTEAIVGLQYPIELSLGKVRALRRREDGEFVWDDELGSERVPAPSSSSSRSFDGESLSAPDEHYLDRGQLELEFK